MCVTRVIMCVTRVIMCVTRVLMCVTRVIITHMITRAYPVYVLYAHVYMKMLCVCVMITRCIHENTIRIRHIRV